MGTTTNPNILFRFSGVLGDYTFVQNPMSMDVLRFKGMSNKIDLLEGEDIYMRPLIDNEVRVMRWEDADYSIYTGLYPFTVRDSLGNIETTYFWDGTVNEFRGDPIHIISLWAQPLTSKLNRYSLELQFKPIQV